MFDNKTDDQLIDLFTYWRNKERAALKLSSMYSNELEEMFYADHEEASGKAKAIYDEMKRRGMRIAQRAKFR